MKNCLSSLRHLWHAFSLIEMLMALLVASLLLAALAPVITRKMNENILVSGTGNSMVLQGGCMFMEGSYEGVCKLPQNTLSIGVIIASGGGGGGGAAVASFGRTNYSEIVNGTTPNASSSNTITLNKNAMDVTVQLVGGGGGGGLGSSNNGGYPKDQTDCGDWGVYIGPEYNGAGDTTLPDAAKKHPDISSGYHSICVSRRNPASAANGGSVSGASPLIAAGKICDASVSNACNLSVCTNEYNCCWEGTTSTACQESANNNDYSGCRRAVCQYNAAVSTCSRWKPSGVPAYGRLPFGYELAGWAPGITYNNTLSGKTGILNQRNSGYMGFSNYPGLQFCNHSTNEYGAVQCEAGFGKCVGGNILSYCDIHAVKGTPTSWNDGVVTAIYLNTGVMLISSLADGATYRGSASSVRCVIDRISSFSAILGGGGGSGLYAEMKIPDDTIRKALSEGTVQIAYTAGGGGKGAYVTSDSNYVKLNDASKIANASSGLRTSASLTVNGVTKWEFSVPGGKAGANASINTVGTGGARVDISSNTTDNACYYKNLYSTNSAYKTGGYFKCSEINDDGSAPNLNAGTDGTNGGAGGNAYFDGVVKIGGGINSTPGLGGGGGGGANTAEGPTREYVSFNKAGDGGGGMARITYKLTRPGAGGGGGGAGAVVHIPNITTAIRPDITFDVKVGAGGKGGIAGGEDDGSNGAQGGTSSIEWKDGSTTRYISLTGGDGGKKGIKGKPDDGLFGADSAPGEAGSVLPVLSMSSGVANKGDYIVYPSDLSKTKGKTVIPNTDYTVNYYAAPGGNGGINSKISPVDKKPCGGWSNIAIDYYGIKGITQDENTLGCSLRNTDDVNNPYAGTFTPYSLEVSSEDVYRPDAAFKANFAYIMSKSNAENYAGSVIGGSTGGGGGGWRWPENQNEQAAAGANGMPGYVIIYWNLENEEGN